MKNSMTSTDTQAAKDFRKALTAAKNRKSMFWRSQAPELASMLARALEQLKGAVQDSQIGVEAILGFSVVSRY